MGWKLTDHFPVCSQCAMGGCEQLQEKWLAAFTPSPPPKRDGAQTSDLKRTSEYH